MSVGIELWKKWEGRLADGKFPLQQWLGGSDHSGVYLTERSGSQKAAIKLIPAENLSRENVYQAHLKDDAQFSRWADVAKLSHPHLLRVFERGRCHFDDVRLLYVVMEFAEENLAEILPLRALSGDEAREMLRPAAEALAAVHEAGLVHGRIQPSNIMAVDNQLKLSTDSLRKGLDRDHTRAPGAYDAPEVDASGPSPAADIWSLGLTLVAVLTQREPKVGGDRGAVAIPDGIPQPLLGIVRQCLRIDPKQRCTAGDIVRRLEPQGGPIPAPVEGKAVEASPVGPGPKRWIFAAIIAVVLVMVAWVGGKFMAGKPATPANDNHAANTPPAVSATPSSTPVVTPQTPVQKASVRGSVLQKVMPEVSRSAENTITGKVKVSVKVAVDASGNVTQAKLVSKGVSQYFSARGLAAAQHWKFKPPLVQGEATGSEWLLRFQFGRKGTELFAEQMKP